MQCIHPVLQAGDCPQAPTLTSIGPVKTALILIAIALIAALPGLCLLRSRARPALVSACLLLLLATGSGYIGLRLFMESHHHTTKPFVLVQQAGHFQIITPAELPAALKASHGRPVLLEFYANWCPSCIVWKDTVFNRTDVQTAMSPLVLLQIDASNMTPDIQQLLDDHQLAGLPAILVYDKQGQEQPRLRLLGEMPAADFIRWLEQSLLPLL